MSCTALRTLLFALVLASAWLRPAAADARPGVHAPERPPNIVFILGDDHGYPYAGFMGSEIVATPNLDRLAEGGTTFTHAHSSASVCRPAMQTLLTGLHPAQWTRQRLALYEAAGVWRPFRTEVQDMVTLPRQLARQGYVSFEGGKHWEGTFEMAGFDAGMATERSTSPLSNVGIEFGRPSIEPMERFLDAVDPDRPFFLQLAPMLPHVPFDASAEFSTPYREMDLHPDAVRYYANVTRLDDVVGRVLEALEVRGLRDDTLIVYVSDNGWEQDAYVSHFLGWSLGGERGKSSIHELGFRSPLIFNWPGRVPASRMVRDPVDFADLHATLLDFAGAPVPPDHRGASLEARIMRREGPATDHVIGHQDWLRVRESEWVPGSGPAGWAVDESASFLRTAQWRYVEWLDRGERKLFRIERDPLETTDVAADHPRLVEAFAAITADWREGLQAPASWMDGFGRLRDAEGLAAAGHRLWLRAQSNTGEAARWQTRTDARGFFRLPNVPADIYTLEWETRPRAAAHRWRADAPVQETDSRPVDLRSFPTAPFLDLRLDDALETEPRPAFRGARLELEATRRGRPRVGVEVALLGWTMEGRVTERAITGPDGVLTFDALPPGLYFIEADPAGGRWPVQRIAFLRAGERARVRLARRPAWLDVFRR